MSYELDMSQYLGLFLQEAREQLEILEQETLKLEQEPTTERLQIIFRAAHTLKGSARAMGFQHLAELTHEMENVLDNLRNGVLQVNTQIADALLACQDSLIQMTDSIEAGSGDSVDCSLLVKQLQGFIAADGTASVPGTRAPAAPSASAAAETKASPENQDLLKAAQEIAPVYQARFTLDSSCALKYVRAFMAISAVEQVGAELILTVPTADDLEEEKFDSEFELFFQGEGVEEPLREKFNSISEVTSFTLRQWVKAPEENAPTEVFELHPSVSGPSADASPVASPGTVATAGGVKKAETGQTVRVDVARLDSLMNLVGELVIDRTRIAQIGQELSHKFNDSNLDALTETVGHIHRITTDLQDQIMKTRMMPIESVFNRYPRVVRDLAQKLGKDVKLDLIGGETELDRSVIEVIGDPLLHILRNSIDHGLETPAERTAAGKPAQGKVVLSARHEENHIVIEIVDDGKGIDVERVKAKAVSNGILPKDQADRMSDKEGLQLIFSSGLSTAAEVSEVSGRGVGMDIVRSNIQKLGGLIDMDTTLGQGTRFSLRLPLTLAIIRGLLVEVGGVVYVTPLGSVVETLMLQPEEIQTVNRREVIVIRGLTTPLVRMKATFPMKNDPKEGSRDNQEYVVIVGLAEQRIGLVVDRLVGEREVVIKSLSRYCGDVQGISGATILGDGNVALILDVNGIVSSQRNT